MYSSVIIPNENYVKEAYALCKKHNVLFIADEVQCGLGRTGAMMCCDHSGIKPDILILGKAISGGLLPLSAILADEEVMGCFEYVFLFLFFISFCFVRPGTHGSTYGGNPLASAVGIAALQVLKNEGMVENSKTMGEELLKRLKDLDTRTPYIKAVRGQGLFAAIDIDPGFSKSAWEACMLLKEKGKAILSLIFTLMIFFKGLLAKPTHKHTIRLVEKTIYFFPNTYFFLVPSFGY